MQTQTTGKRMTIEKLAEIIANSSLAMGQRLDIRFDAIDEKFNAIDVRFDAIEGRIGNVESGLMSTKDDLNAFKQELKQDIARVEKKLDQSIYYHDQRLTKLEDRTYSLKNAVEDTLKVKIA